MTRVGCSTMSDWRRSGIHLLSRLRRGGTPSVAGVWATEPGSVRPALFATSVVLVDGSPNRARDRAVREWVTAALSAPYSARPRAIVGKKRPPERLRLLLFCGEYAGIVVKSPLNGRKSRHYARVKTHSSPYFNPRRTGPWRRFWCYTAPI
jgi:hypothetical protein